MCHSNLSVYGSVISSTLDLLILKQDLETQEPLLIANRRLKAKDSVDTDFVYTVTNFIFTYNVVTLLPPFFFFLSSKSIL